MRTRGARRLKQLGALALVSLLTLLAVRAWDSQHGPPLRPWHTYMPPELTGSELHDADWEAWLAAEQAAFDAVREHVTDRLEPADRVPANRYFAGSPLYPGHFATDWNRSFVLEPDGTPLGAAVLLHGLTDSPYSMRHVAELYRERGFVAVAIRLPGHGTVPAGLARIHWRDWDAATRLAVREARRRAPAGTPLHIVGYSNGGALAMKYALDAVGDPALARPDQLVLLSPMIGVTSFARFAGVLGWPAAIPRFAKAAWLDVLPEFNPFKYNSFPVNGARQSWLVTRGIQPRISGYAREGRLAELPPLLTFQSVVDFTVSTQAVVTALYDHLPPGGHELVLFDVNSSAALGPLLRPGTVPRAAELIGPAPRNYRSTIVAGAADGSPAMAEQVTEAREVAARDRPIALAYPPGVFSLSHVALPFPVTDPLYGLQPEPGNAFGIALGTLALRGERGMLVVSPDALARLTSNPFFPVVLERIDAVIGGAADARRSLQSTH